MSTAIALPGNSDRTFLTHLLARGLENERDVVERQAMGDGDIRRWPGGKKTATGRRKAKRTTVSLKEIQALRSRTTRSSCAPACASGAAESSTGAVATPLLDLPHPMKPPRGTNSHAVAPKPSMAIRQPLRSWIA